MNNAPFYVGQKVVALANSQKSTIEGVCVVKGTVYTVFRCFKCSCGKWMVQLCELKTRNEYFVMCHNYSVESYAGGPVEYFAPIEPRSISIPASLKEQAEELISVKETIQEPEKELA